MVNFFAELKRRHIYRVAIAYAVVAWVLLQLFNNLQPILKLPDWSGILVLVFLVGGFPIVLIFAWTLELKAAPATAEVPSLSGKGTEVTKRRQSDVPSAHPASTAKSGMIAIAVLPFTNLSSDPEQEFFSDGMTEEITAALAQIKGLRVLGRTSAFQFKGQNKNLRAIGQTLGASHLIEGSVRKSGKRVRITAQLVHAGEDMHLWAQNYDRELIDVFTVQEEIAMAIASALRLPLGLEQGDTLVRHRTSDPESYDRYLRAKALLRAPTMGSVTSAANLLEQAVARDAGFAPAWAQLSLAYKFFAIFHPSQFSGDFEQARPVIEANLLKTDMAARRAMDLDPRSADAYMALGSLQMLRMKFLTAGELFTKALTLDEDNPDTLHLYGMMLADLGYLKQAVAVRRRLLALEPFVPFFTRISASILWAAGETEEPITMLRRFPEGFAAIRLAEIYSAQGRYDEAADLLLARADTYLPGVVEDAARLLRSAPTVVPSPQTLPRLGHYLWHVYLAVGAPERFLDFHETFLNIRFLGASNSLVLWAPAYREVRKTERFKAFLRNAGMVEYWRAKGWPDLCRPGIGDDFVCD